jgi:hypothetical protein
VARAEQQSFKGNRMLDRFVQPETKPTTATLAPADGKTLVLQTPFSRLRLTKAAA